MSELRANTISDAAGTGPVELTGLRAATLSLNYAQGVNQIRSSLNVSSTTDKSTGKFTVNTINAFGLVDPAYVACPRSVSTAQATVQIDASVSTTTTSTDFASMNHAGGSGALALYDDNLLGIASMEALA